jgi:valyl-tRNA synthetase
MVEEFGADAVRFTLTDLCTQARQLDLERNSFLGYRNFMNKIWNAARLVFMSVEGLSPEAYHRPLRDRKLALEDRWILSAYQRACALMERNIREYDFANLSQTVYQFFWNRYCDWYLEYVKSRLRGDDPAAKETAQAVMLHVLEGSLRLLHPMIPFVTEELWQAIREEYGDAAPEGSPLRAPACIVASRPCPDDAWLDESIETEMRLAQDAVVAVRNIRGEIGLEPKQPLDIRLVTSNGEKARLLAECEHHFHQLVRVGKFEIAESEEGLGPHATAVLGDVTVHVELSQEILHREIERLKKSIAKAQGRVQGLEKKLANQSFVSNAPPDVVEAERSRLQEAQAELTALISKHEALV